MSRKHVTPGIYLDAVKKARIARACEESLYEFVKHGWETVEPGVPFVDSFHIRVICEHLEAVHRGDIRK